MPKKAKYLIGIDEVGRGPIAGPVTICALAVRNDGNDRKILSELACFNKRGLLNDSKRLSEEQRNRHFRIIKDATRRGRIFFAVSHVGRKIIDDKGIVFAVNIAIKRSLLKLDLNPPDCMIYLDGGIKAPAEYSFQKTVIKGDQTIPIIALSSIAAKVTRDRKMERLSKKIPEYGFEEHKGYGTKFHYLAIRRLGLSEVHRSSFLKNFAH